MKNKLSGVLRKKLWFLPIIIIVIRLALIGVTIRPDLFGINSLLTSVAVIVVLLMLVVAVQASLFNGQKQQRDDTQAEMNRAKKNHSIPFYVKPILMNHLKNQHLTAEAVGSLAQCANVKALVLIHDALDTEGIALSRRTIGLHCNGPSTFAYDLESF